MTVKTSIYLDDELKRQLARLAQQTGTSEAEVVRAGIRLMVAQAPRPRPRLPLGSSGDGGSAERVDQDLERLGFGLA